MSSRISTDRAFTNGFSRSDRNDTATVYQLHKTIAEYHSEYGRRGYRDDNVERSSRDNPGSGNETRSLKRRHGYTAAIGSNGWERPTYTSETSTVSSFRGDNQRSGRPWSNERSQHQRQREKSRVYYPEANRSPARAANASVETFHIDLERNVSRSSNGRGPPDRQPTPDTAAIGSRIIETSSPHKVIPSPQERPAPVPMPDKTAHRKVKRVKLSENGHQVVESEVSEVSPTPDESELRKSKSNVTGESSPAGKANGPGGGECDLSPHETLEMILRKYAPKPRGHELPHIQYSTDEITKSEIQKSDHTLQLNHEPRETPLLKTLAPDEAMPTSTRDPSPLSVRSVCSVNSAKSVSNGSTQSSRKLKKPSCIMCKRPDVPGIDRLLRCGQCSRHYHTSCHNPKIATIMLDTSAWICHRCGSRSGSAPRNTPSSASVDARSEALNKPSSLGMTQSAEKEANVKEETEIQGVNESLDVSQPDCKQLNGKSVYGVIDSSHSGIGHQVLDDKNDVSEPLTPFSEVENETSSSKVRTSPFTSSMESVGDESFQILTTVKDSQNGVAPLASLPAMEVSLEDSASHLLASSEPIVTGSSLDTAPLGPPKMDRPVLSPEVKNPQEEVEQSLSDAPMSMGSSDPSSPLLETQDVAVAPKDNKSSIIPVVDRDCSGAQTTEESKDVTTTNRDQDQHQDHEHLSNRTIEQPQPPSTVSSPPYSPPPAFPNDITDPVPSVRDPSLPVGRYHCRVCRLYNSNEGDVCKNCIPSRGESTLSRLPVEINNHRSPAAFPTGLGIHLGSPPAPKQERAMPVANHSFAIPNRPSQRQFSELRYEKARVPLPPVVMPERRFERMPEQPKRVKTRHELVAEKYKMKPSNNFGLQRPKPTEPSAQVPRPEHRPEHKSVARVTERRLLPDREPSRAARKTAFVGTARSTSTTSSKQPSPKPGSSERRSISNQPSIGPRRPSEESPRPILSARKTAPPLRRGPALKKAGRMLRETYSSDSEDSDEDEAVKAERKRYEQQKKYTKMHMGRASKISRELERERNEKAQLEEQVQKLKEQLRAMGAKEKSDQSVRKKDIYQDWDFSNEEAFPLLPQPEAPPSPEPSPTYRPRQKSWQKSTYVPWDPARLMNLHLHRQRTPSHPPVTGLAAKIVEPEKSEPCATIDGSDDTTTVRVTCKEATTFDEYMGIPKDAIPLVKDASLGFKAGVINRRNNLPDRNAPFFKVRGPGDLKTNIL